MYFGKRSRVQLWPNDVSVRKKWVMWKFEKLINTLSVKGILYIFCIYKYIIYLNIYKILCTKTIYINIKNIYILLYIYIYCSVRDTLRYHLIFAKYNIYYIVVYCIYILHCICALACNNATV